MELGRREFIGGGLIAALSASSMARAITIVTVPNYGLVGLLRAKPGKRADLIAILREGTKAMPGCFVYLINEEPQTDSGIWITEVWDSKDSHDASLSLPDVRAAIAKGRPLILNFETSLEVVSKR